LGGALADLLRAGDRQDVWGASNPAVLPWRSSAALALWWVGDRSRAAKLADEDLALSQAFGAPRAIGIALRTRGQVTDGDEGVEYLQRAVGTLAPTPATLEHARALVDLGARQRRMGHRREAMQPLHAGLDLAHHCGATALGNRALSELRATGARVRRPALTGIEALTPSERRVAELVSTNMTNKQAAQALFVTEKTVEAHLNNAYKKLGCHSRHELRRLMRDDAPIKPDAPSRGT
jgi:DNA-binding CsgD family transcriptional regulator